MRRDDTAPTVVWTVRTLESDIQELEARLPLQGAKTWLIDTGLEKFLDVVAKCNNGQLKHMHDEIALHAVNESPPFPFDTISVRIRRDLYDRFNEEFPEKGAVSWFVRKLVRNFNVSSGSLMIEDYLQRAINMTSFPQ